MTLSFLPFAEAGRAEVYVPAGFVGALETDGAVGDIEVTCIVSWTALTMKSGKLSSQKSHVTLIPGSIPKDIS